MPAWSLGVERFFWLTHSLSLVYGAQDMLADIRRYRVF